MCAHTTPKVEDHTPPKKQTHPLKLLANRRKLYLRHVAESAAAAFIIGIHPATRCGHHSFQEVGGWGAHR